MTMVDSFEKIPVKIYPDLKAGSKAVAKQIADFIREKQKKKEKCVLGLQQDLLLKLYMLS
jgi:glucosamine-6-phosphate deaminase